MATALAATFAESISMGAVADTSRLAKRYHYVSEHQRELDEIHHFPDEVREIFLMWLGCANTMNIRGSCQLERGTAISLV